MTELLSAGLHAQVERARSLIPGVSLSSDFITGFCGETEDEHADTISLMEAVAYEQAFMWVGRLESAAQGKSGEGLRMWPCGLCRFAYSKRERTHAAYKMEDDVPPEVRRSPRPQLTRICYVSY